MPPVFCDSDGCKENGKEKKPAKKKILTAWLLMGSCVEPVWWWTGMSAGVFVDDEGNKRIPFFRARVGVVAAGAGAAQKKLLIELLSLSTRGTGRVGCMMGGIGRVVDPFGEGKVRYLPPPFASCRVCASSASFGLVG